MNRFFSLPQHVLSHIYQFDDTYRLVFDVCCRDVWSKSYDIFLRYILLHTHYEPKVLNDIKYGLKEIFDRIRCDKLYSHKPPVDDLMILIKYKDPEILFTMTDIFWDGVCIRKMSSSYNQSLQIYVAINYIGTEMYTKYYQ